MITLDGDAVHRTRLELNLSRRALAQAVGLAPNAVEAIETGAVGRRNEITLPQLQRLVDTLGVPLGALLADDTPDTPDAHGAHAPEHGPDDTTALGALLLHTRANTPKTDLADALGWTLDRLRLAARALDHQLRPLGMQVHSLRGGYLLRPHDGYKGSVRTRVDRLTGARTGMSTAAAELIGRALAGDTGGKTVPVAHRPQLAALLRDGVLVLDADDRSLRPGPALLDALDVPDQTDPSEQ